MHKGEIATISSHDSLYARLKRLTKALLGELFILYGHCMDTFKHEGCQIVGFGELFDTDRGGLFVGARAGGKRPYARAEREACGVEFLAVGKPIAGGFAARRDEDLLV